VGASNEYPEEGEGLEALFDRFLLRYEVDYIADDHNFIGMLKGSNSPAQTPSITLDELQNLQFFVDVVSVPDEVFQNLAEIRRKLKDEGIRPSDRRFKQSLSLIRAKAMLDQRQDVQFKDLMILAHSLWEVPEQKEIVLDVIKEHAQDRVTTMLETFKQELKEQLKIANSKQITTEAIIEATQKLKGLEGNLKMLAEQNPDRADVLALLKEVQEHRQGMAKNILAI